MRNTDTLKRVTSEADLEDSAQPNKKKRVVTPARREQNKLAQRAYRQRQREQKKQLQQQLLKANPGPRRLEPKPNDDDEEHSRVSRSTSDSAPNDAESRFRSRGLSLVADPLCFQPTGIVASCDPGSISVPQAVGLQATPDESSGLFQSHDDRTGTTTSLNERPDASSSSMELFDRYLGIGRSLEDNRTAVLRACLANALCIGMNVAELMFCEKPCVSPFYQPMPMSDITGGHQTMAAISTSVHDSLPASLRPTWAQILIPHHASLDLIPLPKLRERAILTTAALPHLFSLWEMKLDIYTRDALVLCQVSNIAGAGAGSTTSQPWDKSSWKVAPWFLSKWKMVVDTDEFNDHDNGSADNDNSDFSITGIPGLWM